VPKPRSRSFHDQRSFNTSISLSILWGRRPTTYRNHIAPPLVNTWKYLMGQQRPRSSGGINGGRPSWHYLKRTSTLNLKTSACLNRLRKLSPRRTTTGVVPSRGSSSLGYLKKFNLDPGVRRDDRLKVVP
jgi:hypothetical protein